MSKARECGIVAAALACGLLAACGTSDPAAAGHSAATAATAVESLYVSPADTGDGIRNVLGEKRQHYVVQPAGGERRNVLVIFLGGTNSKPSDYTTLADYVGGLGFAVVDLRYPDGRLIGALCNASDACYAKLRGETIFGADTAYVAGAPLYDFALIRVDAANSIIGRTVALVDYLANAGGSWDQDFWDQFLIADPSSPYTARHLGPAYPDWSKIIVAGHSQGGGDAAFIGMHLPDSAALRRVVMLSAPNDNVDGLISASWISQPSSTPLTRFWGLRAGAEGLFGGFIARNWAQLGGANAGGVGGRDEAERNIGDGSGDPQGAHRLVLDSSGGPLQQHNSTATNDPRDRFPVNRDLAWQYLFTAPE
ncbi:BPSS1187 family protein [Solimonas soli]|uniref:BPSS1187 family protein n=1 Tax=Solimonas soli TaxID=413479 RepID=UPI0004BA205E|nr:hypothetical protein [Solimonas soli]